jgi:hypothetical protein
MEDYKMDIAAGDIRALNENIFSRAADNAMNSICLFPLGRYAPRARALFFSRDRKCLRGWRAPRRSACFSVRADPVGEGRWEERIEKVFRAFSLLPAGRIAPIAERENPSPG